MCLHFLVRADRGSSRTSGTLCTSLCSALAVNSPPVPHTLAWCAVAEAQRLVARDASCVCTGRLYTMLCERLQEENALLCAKGPKVCVSPISSAGQSVGLMSLRPRVRAPHGAFCRRRVASSRVLPPRGMYARCLWLASPARRALAARSSAR